METFQEFEGNAKNCTTCFYFVHIAHIYAIAPFFITPRVFSQISNHLLMRAFSPIGGFYFARNPINTGFFRNGFRGFIKLC